MNKPKHVYKLSLKFLADHKLNLQERIKGASGQQYFELSENKNYNLSKFVKCSSINAYEKTDSIKK